MDEEKLSLHVDSDWKKQAQEEKRKLAEEALKAPPAPASVPGVMPKGGVAAEAATAAGTRQRRGLPPAGFPSLVQSVTTQVLFYLGELAGEGGEPSVNLDMAKHQIDTLTILEEKTVNNLTEEEKRLLDAALYETRMRFVSVAAQVATIA